MASAAPPLREQCSARSDSRHGVSCVAVDAERREFAFGDRDGQIYLVGVDGQRRWKRLLTEPVGGVALSDDQLLSADRSGSLIWFDSAGQRRREWAPGPQRLCSLAVSRDGRYAAVGSERSGAAFLDLRARRVCFWHEAWIPLTRVALSESTLAIVATSPQGFVVRVDQTGRESWRYRGAGEPCGVDIDESGDLVIAATPAFLHALDGDGGVRWQVPIGPGRCRAVASAGHGARIFAAVERPGGRGALLTFDAGGNLRGEHLTPEPYTHVRSAYDGNLIVASTASGGVVLLAEAVDRKRAMRERFRGARFESFVMRQAALGDCAIEEDGP